MDGSLQAGQETEEDDALHEKIDIVCLESLLQSQMTVQCDVSV